MPVKAEGFMVRPRRALGTEMTDEVLDMIVEALVEGLTWEKICQMPGMPSWRDIALYRSREPAFHARCVRAREQWAEQEFDRILVLADKCTNANLDITKVKISALQWRIPKLNKQYADKSIVDTTSTVNVTMTRQIDVTHLDLDEMLALEKALAKTI